MLPDDVVAALKPHLEGAIRKHEPVGGGCIANACRVETDDRVYFLKWSTDDVARTFPPEAAGLNALRTAGSPLFIPEVYVAQDRQDGTPGLLLMEWVEAGREGQGFWAHFGRSLATMHRHTGACYGFERDNFIGRLPQHNDEAARWPDFFITSRLAPQVAMARERGHWSSAWDPPLDALKRRVDDLLPAQPEASVLHGDLWSGNYMVTSDGRAALVDPATYYGHRETDLAMTELFGGFRRRFYEAYREAWPLEPGYEERRDLYNLYHLINHLNHFGSSYAGRVERILRQFG